jgi:hypothetical protein
MNKLVLVHYLIAAVTGLVTVPDIAESFPQQVLWGDTHIHTAFSGDAFSGGVRLDPDAAYRFARGETVTSNSGQPATIGRPLDFVVIADHGNNIGAAYYRQLWKNDADFRNTRTGQVWRAARDELKRGHLAEDALESAALLPAHRSWQASFRHLPFRRDVWQQVTRNADSHNTPGTFTAFIGYEWTPSGEQGSSQHRVVMFADDAAMAELVVPYTSYDSANEEDLWRFMARYESTTGGRVLSIPHNSNLTRGAMFQVTDSFGLPLQKSSAGIRARFEPVVEVTQIKGDSETHPLISPDDEFADYETWNSWSGRQSHVMWNGELVPVRPAEKISGEYARSALKTGLSLGQTLGINPFKFGMIGSTDAHTALAGIDEGNFWGKTAGSEPSAKRIFNQRPTTNWQQNAAGYAAVWATENTRSAIFDAMLRKETYATTGPRMTVRFFGSSDFGDVDLGSGSVAATGYSLGVPMGSDLSLLGDAGPEFLIEAIRDPEGANLDRIQIVKGWHDEAGDLHEQVFNVAMSDGRREDAKGFVKPVGNTVDLAKATFTNTIGDPVLRVVWRDPTFNSDEAAFYYVRVLEIPTPRWTLYDKVRYGLEEIPADVPLITQERAYTSPIWYSPG